MRNRIFFLTIESSTLVKTLNFCNLLDNDGCCVWCRNLPYFSRTSNLDKLRNVITTYVWENLEEGYMQVTTILITIYCTLVQYTEYSTLSTVPLI